LQGWQRLHSLLRASLLRACRPSTCSVPLHLPVNVDESCTPRSLVERPVLTLRLYTCSVGFDSITRQIENKLLKRGFQVSASTRSWCSSRLAR
jgi:hypothetical protein